MSIEDLIPGSRCSYLPGLLRLLMSLLFRYKFRIKAENAYGISDESEESDPFDVNQPLSGKDPWFVLCLIAPAFNPLMQHS